MIDYGLGVELQAFSSEDNNDARHCRNNPKVRGWCRQVGLIDWRQQDLWFDRQSDDPSIKMFSILQTDSIGFLGACGLTDIDHINRRAEFSLYIHPSRHGKGFGRRALLTLLKFGFDELNLNRIWGETMEGNFAINLFETIGFEREGTRKEFYFKNGHYLDAHLISIGRDQFNSSWPSLQLDCSAKE
jgi:UDP-4-amino-4,6-dideoxy-N-acetyl-beta-L-altrosamine N-acetyltransferase